MIRHGQRCDLSDKPEEKQRAQSNPVDSPLTQLGISQAHICGQHQKAYLKEHGYSHIIIESSPFLRCLETAAAFAKELGITEITTCYRASEFLDDWTF